MPFIEIERVNPPGALIVVVDSNLPSLRYGVIVSLQFNDGPAAPAYSPPDPYYTAARFGCHTAEFARDTVARALLRELQQQYEKDLAE